MEAEERRNKTIIQQSELLNKLQKMQIETQEKIIQRQNEQIKDLNS